MNTVKIISSNIDNLKRRIVKFLRLGLSDVQTSIEVGPFGVDSNPIKDMVAIYAETASTGNTFIIGYLNKNQMADVGEYRTYCTDEQGNQKFYTWLKKDGTMEIGGNSNFAVKFNELKTEFNALKADFNNHLMEFDLHTHPGVTSGGATTGITTPSTNTNTSNIDNAKNDKIKTI